MAWPHLYQELMANSENIWMIFNVMVTRGIHKILIITQKKNRDTGEKNIMWVGPSLHSLQGHILFPTMH
jgi:hypothetical protein